MKKIIVNINFFLYQLLKNYMQIEIYLPYIPMLIDIFA